MKRTQHPAQATKWRFRFALVHLLWVGKGRLARSLAISGVAELSMSSVLLKQGPRASLVRGLSRKKPLSQGRAPLSTGAAHTGRGSPEWQGLWRKGGCLGVLRAKRLALSSQYRGGQPPAFPRLCLDNGKMELFFFCLSQKADLKIKWDNVNKNDL